MEFDFSGIDFDFGLEDDKKEETPKQEIKAEHRMGYRHFFRKASSEKALENALDWHFNDGDCYHCFSFVDVDAMTYFKHVLRQQRIKYAAISTWVISGEDVEELDRWHKRGMVGRVDFFIGEIFERQYPEAAAALQRFVRECGGRYVVFRNHAKVMAILGERFDCLIESSANVNTNPRSENTVLTVDSDLTKKYVKLFSEIVPFNKNPGAEPYRVSEQK